MERENTARTAANTTDATTVTSVEAAQHGKHDGWRYLLGLVVIVVFWSGVGGIATRLVAFSLAVVKPGTTSFELRSTDWTLPVGHALAVEIGTIQPGFALENDWIDTPSYETIIVHDARLKLALDDPANDTPTRGDPALWLASYRVAFTEQLSPGTPSFTLPTIGR